MAWVQRQYPRFEAALPLDLRPLGATAPLRTQTHDISLGGLYAEMMFTQEITTVVDITLWIGEVKISARGEVVSKHPSFGNGIKFTRLTDENRERLNQFLQTLQPESRLAGLGSRSPLM